MSFHPSWTLVIFCGADPLNGDEARSAKEMDTRTVE